MLSLIRNAHVHAPEDRGVCSLLVGGGRILALAGGDETLEVTGAEVVDLEGRAVAPGFIDGHAHVTGGGGESGYASRVPPVPLSRYTRAGVTSVVGLLGTDDTTRDTRSLVAQTLALRDEGIGAWCHTGGYHVPPVTLTGRVRDDIVFVDPIIGVGELAISDHRSSQPTLDELLRIASDCHVAGMMSGKAGILHLHLGDGEHGLDLVHRALDAAELPARVYNPTHVNRRRALFDEAVALAKSGVTIDVTAFPVAEDEDGWPADAAVLRYLDQGGDPRRITVSSDGGGCLPVFNEQGEITAMEVGKPDSLAATLQALVGGGLALAEALAPFTRNVAHLLRLHDRGRIAPGAAADLLVLDERARITDVMAGGRWHVRDGRQQLHGRYERPASGRGADPETAT